MRSVENNNGFECWRLLVKLYEPRTRNKQLALLDSVLHPQLTGANAQDTLDLMTKWETECTKYGSIATPFSDDVKVAVLITCAPESLRYALLQFIGNSTTTLDYAAVREYVSRVVSSPAVWDDSRTMDVGPVKGNNGKGKYGKGKDNNGKGKDKNGKGKGKDKTGNRKPGDDKGTAQRKHFDGYCRHCNK